MICHKCKGRCTHERRPDCNHSLSECYYHGCHEQITCRTCGGIGYLGMGAVKQLLIEIRGAPLGKVRQLAEKALKYFNEANKGTYIPDSASR